MLFHIDIFGVEQERSKALGYMTSNALSSVNEEKPESLESGINELKITIHRCRKLKSTTKGKHFSFIRMFKIRWNFVMNGA